MLGAVFGAESSFTGNNIAQAQARSSGVGAHGIAQLMPATARGLGVDINNPEQNAVGGAILLRTLVDRYHGNVALALAAYNWGPGNVDAVKGNLAAMPIETQNYVRKILGAVTGGR